jgi:hypothetical protein
MTRPIAWSLSHVDVADVLRLAGFPVALVKP